MERSHLRDYLGIRTYYLARALFRSVIDQYSVLDALSTWTLAAAGIAVGFLFTNFEKLNAFQRPGTVRWILWLLVISIAMGLFQKFFAVRLEAASKFDNQFITQLNSTINALAIRAGHEADMGLLDLNLKPEKVEEIEKQLHAVSASVQQEYLNSLCGPLRWPFHWLMKRQIDRCLCNSLQYSSRW